MIGSCLTRHDITADQTETAGDSSEMLTETTPFLACISDQILSVLNTNKGTPVH